MGTTATLIVLAFDGPEHNARGFFVIGPQCVNPSDVLAKLIGNSTPRVTASEPKNRRRADVVYTARAAAWRRERGG